MVRTLRLRGLALAAAALPRLAQAPAPTPAPAEDIQITIRGGAGAGWRSPFRRSSRPGRPALQAKVAEPFTATLRSDLEYAGAFAVAEPAHYPAGYRDPTTPEAADRWLGTGAEALIDTRGEIVGRQGLHRGPRLGPEVPQAHHGPPLLGRRDLRRAHRPHARQRPRQVLHRQAGALSLDDPLRDRSGRHQGDRGHGLRRARRPAADLAQVDRHQPQRRRTAGSPTPPTSTSIRRSGRWPSTAATSARFRRASSSTPRPRSRPTAARSPSPARPRATPTSTRSASRAAPARRLTTSRALEASPAWSPTGRQILYTSDLTGTPQIYVMDAEGTGSRRVTLRRELERRGGLVARRLAHRVRLPQRGRLQHLRDGLRDRPDDPDHLRGLERPPVVVARRREDRLLLAAQRIDADLHDGRERPEQAPADAAEAITLQPCVDSVERRVRTGVFANVFAILGFRAVSPRCELRSTDLRSTE